MTLNAELQAFYQARQEQMPADVRDVMNRATSDLVASGQDQRILSTGDRAPLFELADATGQTMSLGDYLSAGPVVLTFYRGAWCPYCNITLRALHQANSEINARGARLVAVSPQIPDDSLSLAEKHQLDFDLLSDPGCETAKLYGLSYDLGDDLAAVYERIGLDLNRANAGFARTLPISATFVIAADGTITWSYGNADYTKRAEPTDILAALDALGTPGAPA